VGSGSIVVNPASTWHPCGSQVRLTALPVTGNYLVFWANAAVGRTDNPLTFTITNANPTVTAVFASLGGTKTNALTVIPDGRGQVTLTPRGNCFPLNTNVVLKATPDSGQEFLGWTGAASGSENPLVVTMNSNKVITASFTKRPSLHFATPLESLVEEGFRLTFLGEFGAHYQILASTNLSDWHSIATLTSTYGTAQFTDPAGVTNNATLYRLILSQ
jgi:Divergent InlB B-repeat domain